MPGPLDPQLVEEVKRRLANGDSQSKVARETKVCRKKVNEIAREVPKPTIAATTIVRDVQADYAREVKAAMPPASETAAAIVSVGRKLAEALPRAVDYLVAVLDEIDVAPGIKVQAASAIGKIAREHAEKMDDDDSAKDNTFVFTHAQPITPPRLTIGGGDAERSAAS